MGAPWRSRRTGAPPGRYELRRETSGQPMKPQRFQAKPTSTMTAPIASTPFRSALGENRLAKGPSRLASRSGAPTSTSGTLGGSGVGSSSGSGGRSSILQ